MTAIIIIRALALLLLMHLYSLVHQPISSLPPSISIIPCLGRPFILLPQHIHLCNPRTLCSTSSLASSSNSHSHSPLSSLNRSLLCSLTNNNKIRFTCVCLMHCNPDTTIIMHFPCCTLSVSLPSSLSGINRACRPPHKLHICISTAHSLQRECVVPSCAVHAESTVWFIDLYCTTTATTTTIANYSSHHPTLYISPDNHHLPLHSTPFPVILCFACISPQNIRKCGDK